MNPIKDWTLYIVHGRPKGSSEPWFPEENIFNDPDEARRFCNAIDGYEKDTEYAIFEFVLNDNEDWRKFE